MEDMLNFLLYCDLSTMNCSASDINTELSDFANSYVQVNNSLWFFKYPDGFDGNPLPKDEHLFYDHFEKFTDEDSVIFLAILDKNHYYNLPENVVQFLSY